MNHSRSVLLRGKLEKVTWAITEMWGISLRKVMAEFANISKYDNTELDLLLSNLRMLRTLCRQADEHISDAEIVINGLRK
jgi:hypothetical protein